MSGVPHRRLSAVTLVVRDYDEAIAWYREKLGFVLIEDTPLEPGKRWVLIAATASGGNPAAVGPRCRPGPGGADRRPDRRPGRPVSRNR
jgi:catechol 2,3-dioxygenase-like lactoylglutathione lyase family enzyme